MANSQMTRITDSGLNISYNAKYDTFFPPLTEERRKKSNLDEFSSTDREITESIAARAPDFEVASARAVRTHNLFSWAQNFFSSLFIGIIALPQTIVRKIILAPLYPAQSAVISLMSNAFTTYATSNARSQAATNLKDQDFYFRHLVFKVHGSLYSALLAGHKNTIGNGKWITQATGNGMPGDHVIDFFAKKYRDMGCNVLIVNNPRVGASLGSCTTKTIQDAQEAGILFLEHAVKAKTIGICGLSFGGAAVAAAIEQHRFLADRKYFVVRQVAFDSISNICGEVVKMITGIKRIATFTKYLVKWCGLEIDAVKASRVLVEKEITEIIIQATTDNCVNDVPTEDMFTSDQVIPAKASLGYRLVKLGITQRKVFVGVAYLSHNDIGEGLIAGESAIKDAMG